MNLRGITGVYKLLKNFIDVAFLLIINVLLDSFMSFVSTQKEIFINITRGAS